MTSCRPHRSSISGIILQAWCGLTLLMAHGLLAEERHPVLVGADLAVRRLESAAGGKLEMARSPLTGLVTFVSAGPRQSIPPSGRPEQSAEARSLALLGDYGPAFGLTDSSALTITAALDHDA